jgi:hypothetical protein
MEIKYTIPFLIIVFILLSSMYTVFSVSIFLNMRMRHAVAVVAHDVRYNRYVHHSGFVPDDALPVSLAFAR